ncbi:SusC/RagA family TonB-linked outer membrane protein [Polaribacter sp. IC066]|uniref:SusC/RagA family TonB-linked outer membrane protein n=1 Tax=Polaribacter sp. IC066 TaxID=57032 RepID=UPI0011BD788E|nr:SusC/RagA family TonB-linked outer membrane protein [Polaribacter sp. IC066]TXD62867.1 SusC/RagA family TonB-linked outer membrane protein [Polaribacter sp. IC066]
MKTKFKGILTLLLAFIVQITFAQEKTVSGTVSESSGVLPGVSVSIQGTNKGTETDFDGKYSIKTKLGDVLLFRYLGYKTIEKTVGNTNVIDTEMIQDASVLDEIVVTALGIKREKKSLGFAQQSVKGEQLVQTREVDINNSIAGRVAGVQILGAPSSGFGNALVRLRGESDLLYVVDGVKISNASDINTDDIEDLSVLKGSAATALYGPIGKNGVVVITSKKGKNGKTTIVLDQSVQISNVYILPDYQNEYGGGYTQEFAMLNGQKIPNYAADESWGPRLDGSMVRHWDSWIEGSDEFGELRPWSANPNNVQNFFNSGITNNTSLNFTKGGEGYSVKANLRNVDIEGVMPNSSRKQQQIGVSASFDVNDKLEVYSNINYQHRSTINNPLGGYGGVASNFNQWWQRQTDIDRLRDNDFQNGQWYTWNLRSTSDTGPQYWDSPFFETENNTKNQVKDGNFGANYAATENLSLNVELRRTVNTFRDNSRVGFGGLNQTAFNEREQTISSFEFFAAATYNKDLTDDLDLTATVGTELRQDQERRITSETVGGLTIPGVFTIASSKDRPSYVAYNQEQKNNGLFATASLGFKDMLYLDGSLRGDWNSNAYSEENRVITYGLSGSFLFSKLIKSDVLSFGKLRLGYAEAPDFPRFGSTTQTYQLGSNYEGTVPFYNNSNQANPTIQGGVRTEFEIGTEMQFFKRRLGLDFTYFNRKDENLAIDVPLSPASGYFGAAVNSGKFTSSGIELALNGTPITNDNFTWNIGVNFATLRKTTDELYIDPETGEAIESEILDTTWRDITIQSRVGEEFGAIYGRKITRDDSGNMLIDDQGRIEFEQNQYLGNLLPDFTGGLTNTFRYKNFSVSANIDFQSGGKFFSVSQMFGHYSGLLTPTVGDNELGNPVRDAVVGSAGTANVVNANDVQPNSGGVLVSGVDSNSGAPVSYYVESQTYWGGLFALHEKWLYDASYVKLRQVSIGYDLPVSAFDKSFVESVSLNLFANNLWLIYSSVDGIDPSEIENTSAAGLRWEEGGQLPSARTFGLNVKIKF